MQQHATLVKFPFYVRMTLILLLIGLLTVGLYFGRSVFIPIFLSLLFAILLRPMEIFFNKRLKIPHVLSTLITVVIFVIAFAALVFFVSWQATQLTEDWMSIKKNIGQYVTQLQQWVQTKFGLSFREQQQYVEQVKDNASSMNSKIAGQTFTAFTDLLVVVVLAPVYIFLFLLYKKHLKNFLYRLVPDRGHEALTDILLNAKIVIQNYLVGLLVEMAIVCTLVTVGLMLVGAKYALLLGLIAAISNLIPYIGITFATILAMFVTLAETAEIGTVLGVMGVNIVVQLIDNNFLVPKIVGSKVKINALMAILVVVVGGTIAGVAGMFMAIPITAMLKVIFDRVNGLQDWGYLMGDDSMPYHIKKTKENA